MASSQVEIASSSPFGCVLKDHNRRKEKFRESNSAWVSFDNNLQELVRGHIYSSITIYDENRQWLHQDSNKVTDDPMMSLRQSRILETWAEKQAEKVVSAIENQSHEAEMLAQSSNSLSSVGAASLVKTWEVRFSHCKSSKITSGLSCRHMEPAAPSSPNYIAVNENDSSVDSEESAARIASNENQDENSSINNDNNSNDDDNLKNENSSERERERVKVSYIIRKLKLEDQTQAFVRDDCSDQEQSATNTPQR